MPTPQRLPIVNSDDGTWGDILRQFLMKEHYNDDTNNAVNGGHKTITVQAGTATAGTAPLKFTSGTLLTAPEAGAIEFNSDKLYFTKTTGPTRQTVAAYDTTGSTGDIYYRDSSANFVRLAIGGSDGKVLTVASGIPSWSNGPTLDNTSTITVKDANFTVQDDSDATKQLQFQLSGITTGTTRTLTVPNASTTIVGTDSTQTLTNKTLTDPKVNTIKDTNGNTVFSIPANASTVNYLEVNSGNAGFSASVFARGSDTNIGIGLSPKGSGNLYIYEATGQTTATLAATGSATNVNLSLTSQGTGVVKVNNVEVATISGTQTLTNKTLTAPVISATTSSAGTAMKLTSGTVMTTPEAGALEYDSTAFYATAAASTRQAIDAEQFITLTSTYTLTSQTAAQKLFNSSTNGAVTLAVGTYYFECFFSLSSMSSSSGDEVVPVFVEFEVAVPHLRPAGW